MKQFVVEILNNQVQEDGTTKRVRTHILVEAESYTDVEATTALAIEQDKTMVTHGDYTIDRVTKTTFSDIFGEYFENGINFKVKVSFVSIDEAAGKEKLITQNMLINAEDIQKCMKRTLEEFKNFTVPYSIDAINPTKIEQVIFQKDLK